MSSIMSLSVYEPRSISVITLCLSIYYLLSSSVLGALLAIRALSIENLQRWPLFKVLTCLALLAAYLFVFAEAIMVLGLQGAHSIVSVCVTGTWLCIILYMIFKLVYYVFLMERVHLVYSSKRNIKIRRLQAPWYRVSLVVVVAWVGVAIAMIIGRIVETSNVNDVCVSGVRTYASIALLIVDASVCTVLTLAFALPVWRSRFSKAQRLALTSCIATGIGTLASFGNLLWMTHAEGREKRWVRGFSSSLDIFISAVLTFIITNSGTKQRTTGAGDHHVEANGDRQDDSTSSPESPGKAMTQVPVRPLDGVVITSHVVQATEEDNEEKEQDHDGDSAPGMDHKSSVASAGWLDRILYDRSARRKKSLGTVPTAERPFTANTIMLQETTFSRPQTASAERARTASMKKDSAPCNETGSLRGVGMIEHRTCDSFSSSRASILRQTHDEERIQMC
ncbi:BQ2448_4273 [Microbotryum intermedium]|uniref:BQ2448_4273 protein n=1 Tax=Microbotryum intermedium TaxID=269621 RepID=A0A238FNS3_9BASI|nr:BQ2448_4273 [Microbotryum intermedium]